MMGSQSFPGNIAQPMGVPSAAMPVQKLPTLSGNPATQAISLGLLLVFLFFAYGRILDYYGSSLHLPLILSTLAMCFALISGGILRIFRSAAGVFLVLYLCWMTICVPLAFWRGGSFQALQEFSRSFLVFLLIVASLRRSRNVKHACYAIAMAMVVVIVLCFARGVTDFEGRLTLVTGLLGNSNDLAMVLLMGLPFWILFATGHKRTLFRWPLAAVVLLLMMYMVMKTGSRAVLMGSAVVVGMFFLSASLANKLKLGVAGVVAAAVLMVATPGVMRERLATLLRDGENRDMLTVSALESTSSRTQLLKRSLAMTIRHPVFGVGPGNFQPASASALGRQIGPAWYETHNTMTQISSEMGIPGLFWFCGALFCCFRSTRRLSRWKPPFGQPISKAVADHIYFLNRIGSCLMVSLVSLTLTACFSSIAYHIFFPTVIGLCTALELTSKEELDALFPRTAAAAQPNNSAASGIPNSGRLRPAV